MFYGIKRIVAVAGGEKKDKFDNHENEFFVKNKQHLEDIKKSIE
jgi:hypothetical protein